MVRQGDVASDARLRVWMLQEFVRYIVGQYTSDSHSPLSILHYMKIFVQTSLHYQHEYVAIASSAAVGFVKEIVQRVTNISNEIV